MTPWERDRTEALRRGVLRLAGALGAATVGTGAAAARRDHADGAGSAATDAGGSGSTGTDAGGGSGIAARLRDELRTRVGYSRARLREGVPTHPRNDRVSSRAVVSKFGKGLAHDLETGLPTTDAYESLVAACEAGEGYEAVETASFDLDNDGGIVDEIDLSPLVDDEAGFGPRPLVQPESAWTYLTEGYSTAQLEIARPPAFSSAEAGAEMVELYWRALARDVPFREYPDSEAVNEAVVELRGLDGYRGPGSDADRTNDRLGRRNVFRGVVPGAQTGPHVSQFMLKDRALGRGTVDQRLNPPVAESTPADYVTDVGDWLKIQRGVPPGVDRNLPGNEVGDEPRYIVTGRDLAERVHDDPPFRQLQKAAQVLLFSMQAPLDEGIPYTMAPFETQIRLGSVSLAEDDAINGRQEPSRRDVDRFLSQTTLPFNDFGPLYVEKKLLEVTEHAQKAAWHKKWNVHRRLRPEEYGGRLHAVKNGDLPTAVDYPVPENLATAEAVERTEREFGTALLPQAYAEGSPVHPSYPAGHSVVAGAGVTLLKALFDGDYVFASTEKVVPNADGTELLTAADLTETRTGGVEYEPGIFDELTVRGELNKLAANMALGRNWGGIHYRSDGIEGLRLGERAAIAFVEDQLTLAPGTEEVTLTLETFDGEERRLTGTE